MHRHLLLLVVALGVGVAAPAAAKPAAAVKSAAKPAATLLNLADFRPQLLVAPPPAAGSPAETADLDNVRRIVATASPVRLVQAKWDGEHEDPSAFDAVMGRRLADLPATMALLTTVQHETDVVIDVAKDHFARTRPWGVDPTLPNCSEGKGKKPTRSYPSGHSGFGYSVGWTLAQLVPNKAPAILTRAQDYALSRVVCGVHFPSDTEASHVIATVIASRLLADPRLSRQVAAARSELAAIP